MRLLVFIASIGSKNKHNSMCGVIQSLILDVNNVLYQKVYYVIKTWNKFYNTL